jgi:ubiquinone/menaquinone biosynthesis C-methylase UbiE
MKKNRLYAGSRVETSGSIAPYYDLLLDIATGGFYPSFIKSAIKLMGIAPGDKILDLGAGTGRNACLMMEHLSEEGELIGVDISSRMISQFRKKCSVFKNARIINARVDQPLHFKKQFDKVFISFVLHGFPQRAREEVIENAFRALKARGLLFILDYNEFSIKKMPFYSRAAFKLIECSYALDFIERDWKRILEQRGFHNFEEHSFFSGYVRLLKAVKVGSVSKGNANEL